MTGPAKIIVWILIAAGAAAVVWIVGVRPSGPTLQDDAEKARAEQRGHNAEICRLARDRLRQQAPDQTGGENGRDQDKAVVRVKCEPLGL